MKKIIMFVLLFAALKVAGQTTGYLRFDTVRIMKQNGTCELYIINKTKDSLGLLTNVGGGLTSFKRPRVLNDSQLVVGNDTLKIIGTNRNIANTQLTATGNFIHDWDGKNLWIDDINLLFLTANQTGIGGSGLHSALNRTQNGFFTATLNNTAEPLMMRHAIRTAANNADSIYNFVRANQGTTMEIGSTNVQLAKSAYLSLNQGGAAPSKAELVADSVRIKGKPVASADSAWLVGPYDPATGTNVVYKGVAGGAICQWPSERQTGTIYEKSSWVNTGDFTTNGSAALAVNGSFLDLSGGSGYGDDYVTLLGPSVLSKWNFTTTVKLTGALTATSGLAVGLHFLNTSNPYDISANFSFGTGGPTPIYIATTQGGGTVYQTSAGTLTFSLNDVIKIEVDFNVNSITATATNLTTGAPATTTTYTWATPADAASEIPNTCNFAIYSLGGTQQLQHIKISSTETRYASVGLIGDSKYQVGFASTWAGRIGPSLNGTYATTITRAGEGDGVNHVLMGIDEIRLLAPRIAILNIGSNSYRDAYTTPEIIATYDSLTAAIEAIGTRVYHIVMPEDTVDNVVNAAGMTFLKNYISGKYGSSYISGVWDTLADGSNRLKAAFDNGDGIHLNQAGVDATVAKIISSGVIATCAERLSDDNFMTSQIANASTSTAGASATGTTNYVSKFTSTTAIGNSQLFDDGTNIGLGTTTPLAKFEIPGNDLTASKMKVGTFEVQSADDANGFLSNNGRFNGTAWQYRVTAASVIMQYMRDSILFYSLPSASAGSTTTTLDKIKFSVGPSDVTSLVQLKATGNAASSFGLTVTNSSSNASASAVSSMINDASYLFNFGMRSSAGSTYGTFGNNTALVYSTTPANMGLMVDNATGYINFATGGNSERMAIAADGTVKINGLAGSGTRMVTADASGNLSTQAIPSGSQTLQQVLTTGSTLTTNNTIANGTNQLDITGSRNFADGYTFGVTNTTGTTGIAIKGIAADGRGVWGTATSGQALYGNATSGIGVFSLATTGNALYAQSTSGLAIESVIQPASTNTVVPTVSSARGTSGTAGNGIGQSIDFYISTTTASQLANQIITKWTDATNATRTSQFEIWGVNAGSIAQLFTITGSGNALIGTTTDGGEKFQVVGSVALDIGSDATGDIYTRNSSGALARIAAGTSGHVLTSNGAGTQPTYQAPVANSDLTGAAVKATLHIVSDADYTVASTDYSILYSNMTAARTLTLPAAASNTNRILIIKNGGNGAFAINLSASIRENTTTTTSAVGQGSWVTIQSDGSEWWIIQTK